MQDSQGSQVRTVRLFVSSPGDVDAERQRVQRVAQRLNGEFANLARIDTVRWETSFYSAHATFQAQIPEAADCDIVVAIFWARLGSELPSDFPPMPDGEPYPSGTAYEVLSAIRARETGELPDIFVFRKIVSRLLPIDDDIELARGRAQWTRLCEFFERWFVSREGHFRAAFQSFESTDDFEMMIESLLREWLEKHVLHGRSVAWPIEIKGSPFRGLAPFDAEHASVFFGRSREISRAIDQLQAAAEQRMPFLIIVGASGAGKSSLVRAGLVPRIITPGVIGDVDIWRVAVMRPSSEADPVAALAEALFSRKTHNGSSDIDALPELAEGDYKAPHELASLLRNGNEAEIRPILRALDRAAAVERQRGGFERQLRTDLLLVVDQLDDLFAASVSAEDRAAFAKLLRTLVSCRRVWVIATLRAALYEPFLAQSDLKALKDAGSSYDLTPPGPVERAEIVRRPAAAAALVYEINSAGESLDEHLLWDAAGSDTLPLLQFTLQRLFEQREVVQGQTLMTFAAYAKLGGIDGAIDQAAEAALSGLGEQEIAALPRLLRQLAIPVQSQKGVSMAPGTSLTIRAAKLDDAAPSPSSRQLVDALVEARILLLAEEGGVPTVRLAHQRVLESWKRAQEAVRANADFYRIVDDVGGQLRRWILSGAHPSTLLPVGRPLEESKLLPQRFPEETRPELRHFINASTHKARMRKVVWSPFFIPIIIFMLAFIGQPILGKFSTGLGEFGAIAYIFVAYPACVFLVQWLYEKEVSQLSDCVRGAVDVKAEFKIRSYASRLKIVRYALIGCLVAIAIGLPLIPGIRDHYLPHQTSLLIKPYENFVAIMIFMAVVLMVPIAKYLPELARIKEDVPIGYLTRRILGLPLAVGKFCRFPPAIIVLLAVFSGVISEIAFSVARSGFFWGAVVNPGFYVPPLTFGLVLSFGEFRWGSRELRKIALILPAVVAAWILAYFTACGIAIRSSTAVGYGLAGLAAGAVGAGLSAITVPTLHRENRWKVSALMGALTGLLLSIDKTYGTHILFVAWQTSFAAYFAYSLGKWLPAGHKEVPSRNLPKPSG